ncbi:hypothetical protein ACFE04_008056 [Oxalis oulophora]
MDTRLANTWKMTLNEKKFIESALLSGLRIDGRNPFEYRKLTIKFGRDDASSEVQLGQTHVMAFVTAQLLQPYKERPNEGSLAIFTEFSPMADPSFEPGRPGESAVELGRIIDRGLRESRAVDTESLCVLAGKLVWAIRVDLHILDNGGNLVDAANIAALTALMTFRRPDCTLGGEDGQQVTLHPPEVRDPLPLIVHHLPIAVTYAFFSNDSTLVVDPTHKEEYVMAGKMTVTVNANGDICAIQKPGGQGVLQSVVLQCLRLAHNTAEDITKKIKDAVEAYSTERALRKIKWHPNYTASKVTADVKKNEAIAVKSFVQSNNDGVKTKPTAETTSAGRDGSNMSFSGGPSSWDPYSKGVDIESLKASLASQETKSQNKKQSESTVEETQSKTQSEDNEPTVSSMDTSETEAQHEGIKTLKDAVKPKNKRKKRAKSTADASFYSSWMDHGWSPFIYPNQVIKIDKFLLLKALDGFFKADIQGNAICPFLGHLKGYILHEANMQMRFKQYCSRSGR